MDTLHPGEIVKLNTACIWNQCSGLIDRCEVQAELVIVKMPGGEKLAFLPSEVELY
ncbi:hypothetical protein [Alteromonas gilva]|uniref:Uncharacterized protein n=1 Tax=Alteromonas gilva TaxID=2987522 RepID=A0ABT5L9M1_9ALTE|nr:hypothetical protein [Alteromonas gilva]MDC8832822.1 hypothetical protein [Alteromonas gilva]